MLDDADRKIVAHGPFGAVVCAIRSSGSSPAYDFLKGMLKDKHRQFYTLFDRMVTKGQIYNTQQFKKVEGRIWEFKRFQHRIGCYRDRRSWVLTHGFIKKGDAWRKSELERAKEIMLEDQERATGLREQKTKKEKNNE